MTWQFWQLGSQSLVSLLGLWEYIDYRLPNHSGIHYTCQHACELYLTYGFTILC